MSIRLFYGRLVDFLKKHPALPVLVLDVLAVPGIFLCRWLLQVMLETGKPCKWTLVGAKCATCGGTHCVQSFLQADFSAAFFWNPMVFCWILYAIATGILLNLHFVFRRQWAGMILKRMYSLSAFFIGLGVYLLFTLVRNLPLLMELLF